MFQAIKNLFRPKPIQYPVNTSKWNYKWDEGLYQNLENNYETLATAKDLDRLRPNFLKLSKENQLRVFAEFIKAIAYYESAYNEKNQNVDVGKKSNKDTWSIGLMQVSVIDQKNYKLDSNYNYDQLLIGKNNLDLAVKILTRQIKLTGHFILANSDKNRYWAVTLEGNRYSQLKGILNHTNNLELIEDSSPLSLSVAPWFEIAEKEIGQKEIVGTRNNPRITEYHSVTKLNAKDDETSWCASFVCWCLDKSFYKHTRSAWARDYLNFGEKLEKPKLACIMIFERGSKGGTSHVGFWTGKETKTHYEILGGNQKNSVCKEWYSKTDFLGARWPV